MNFKRASAPCGGTINVIDITESSELLPATLFLTSDHPDHHLTKSRLKNVKKNAIFWEIAKNHQARFSNTARFF